MDRNVGVLRRLEENVRHETNKVSADIDGHVLKLEPEGRGTLRKGGGRKVPVKDE